MPDYRIPAADDPERVRSESERADYGESGETILRERSGAAPRRQPTEASRVTVPADRERAPCRGPLSCATRPSGAR
ncbi:hypothetical protein DSL92_05800 [Billgrantia gudaonensis]|uniref:Uncharacterized protein n=1 Tax=Billgrantia gudaonensis TaxID=376427 RepID=A0A432JJF7_9GAMM|nr:hypothetical protein DSL92_05800 [Halomonas gudaonensis]